MQEFIDPATPRNQLAFEQLPRGFIAFPECIKEQLEREQERKGFRFADEYVQDSLEKQTLAYYYDGLDVAYRPAESGIEVLGIGWQEAWPYRNDPTVKVVQA